MHFSLQSILLAGALLAGAGSFANPICVENESPHFALEERIAPIIFPLIWDALALLKDGAAFSGQVVNSMFGSMASSQPYKSKNTCRVQLTASKNDKFGD